MKPAGIMLSLAAVLGVSGALNGQTPDAKPAFEVASIKPSAKPTSQRIRVSIDGGPGTNDPTLLECRNCSVSMLMMRAYDVKYYQLSGPGSRSEELFDITARIAEGTTKEQLRLMLQNLLADRLKLTLHREIREMQTYLLVVAKKGPKINASTAGRALNPSLAPSGTGMAVIDGQVRMRGIGESMEQFSSWLANQLDLQVIDSTGLKGKYDFSLYWAADSVRGALAPVAGAEASAPLTGGRGDSGPTLFDALQSQLGLKLEQKKGPVEIIVVDHVEKTPTGN
jgi:uncharacterized protein (TIGR03435 family)